MRVPLKPLNEQVMVITGASSGIGLATARAAARKGVKLVLAARSEHALREIVQLINAAGGVAIDVPCDVARREEVQRVADAAITHFGQIDTWVNDAGVSIYGRLDEISEQDFHRLFDTNFWGVVNGSLVALPYLRQQGGALINLGSEVSDGTVPLQGMYVASKQAVKGFTDALRVEIEQIDRAPVAITLIQPSAVDTPFPQHGRNYMAREPRLPNPTLKAEDVAEAILHAAVKHTRDRRVGSAARVNTLVSKIAPGIMDPMDAALAHNTMRKERPRNPEGALYKPSESTDVVGQTAGTGGTDT